MDRALGEAFLILLVVVGTFVVIGWRVVRSARKSRKQQPSDKDEVK